MANRLKEVGFCSNADQKKAAATSRIKHTSRRARSLRFSPAKANSQIKYSATEAAITYTSALATAAFLKKQAPGCTAFVIGAPGLLNALYDVGVTMNDVDPDYVIVGETASYNYEVITKAVRLVLNGARLIATNSDLTGPTEFGIAPACRSLVAPIELATGRKAYFMGKPNPLMMRTGLHLLGVHSEEAAMVGDRMDTDVIAGMESGLATVLVLSGCTSRTDVNGYPYRPTYILNGVGEIVTG